MTALEMAQRLGVGPSAVSKYLNRQMKIGGEFLMRALVLGIVVNYGDKQVFALGGSPQQIHLLLPEAVLVDTGDAEGLTVKLPPRKQPNREHAAIQIRMIG